MFGKVIDTMIKKCKINVFYILKKCIQILSTLLHFTFIILQLVPTNDGILHYFPLPFLTIK